MQRKSLSATIKTTIVLLVCLPLLLHSGTTYPQPAGMQETYKNLEVFSNVLSIIQQNYVEEINVQEVIEGAIKGMLNSLDPHSSFMKPEDFKELQVETKGSFSGIGIEITIKDGILTVVSPIEGTPAFKKGIQAGDLIIKIENEPTKDMSLMEAVKKLRGVKGTEVTISIHREGWPELKEITMIRDVIPLHSVRAKTLEPGYGYIRITNFQTKTTADLKKALEELTSAGDIKGLVLDLRNNPGGLLDQSVKVADQFIKEGVIVSTKGRLKDQNMEFTAHSRGKVYTLPLVVLVNGGSASASEIVAGALQDHKRALILGTQTFGKGSVQTIIPMNDGAGLRLTTARYYTPNGTSIQAKGITPDILVPLQPARNDATEKSQPRFLREKDLRHHLKNGDEPMEENDADQKIDENNADDEDLSEGKEALEKDNQLQVALLILKGLNVFSGMEVTDKANNE